MADSRIDQLPLVASSWPEDTFPIASGASPGAARVASAEQIAEHYEGRRVGARIALTTNQSITSGSWTKIRFQSESSVDDAFDIGGVFDSATSVTNLNVPTGAGGVYLVVLHVKWGSTLGSGQCGIRVRGTGGGGQILRDNRPILVGGRYQHLAFLHEYNAGTYFYGDAWQNSGSSINVEPETWMGIYLLDRV